jgi:hypothetical protein
MLDPESLMFSLPHFKLPFGYRKKLVESQEQAAARIVFREITKAFARAFTEHFEKQAMEVGRHGDSDKC